MCSEQLNILQVHVTQVFFTSFFLMQLELQCDCVHLPQNSSHRCGLHQGMVSQSCQCSWEWGYSHPCHLSNPGRTGQTLGGHQHQLQHRETKGWQTIWHPETVLYL